MYTLFAPACFEAVIGLCIEQDEMEMILSVVEYMECFLSWDGLKSESPWKSQHYDKVLFCPR